MIVKPKDYQSRAVENALEIFRCALAQIAAAPDLHSQRAASAFNGCVLVQAPTGSGKTLIAGLVAEAFSRDAPICWLWLTPFKGLVEQARIAIKNQFAGLRVRDIDGDRVAHSTQSGDVFVTTWAAVAASRKESRRLRQDGDHAVSLDHLTAQLRQRGFKLGVVVDEAHHTFSLGTEAMRFYRETLQPEFTLLITATPDDKDAEAFRKASGIAVMHRITVSRLAAVDAHLIKPGIKSVAYLADAAHKTMVDFGLVALTDGVRVHQAIKVHLQAAGIDLTPLLLVQVGSSAGSVEQAKQNLMALGLKEDAIAIYTADEPNDDLLAVARDESKEALIFKMAVALGFDAPRAFALVALRGARDADFGVQIVGRILRVDWRLQNKPLPELLRYGYVFLADAETQTGLMTRLERECRDRGMLDIAEVPDRLRRAMHLILAWHPRLLREAVRLCCAENAELVDTAALPETVNWPDGLKTARLGAYGVFPPDLNNDEHAFAQLLDGDTSGVVEWWHRNEDRKPWSVGLVMPDGAHYYPDFIVKARGREKGGGLLLLEVKGPHLINSPKTPDKVQATHQLYRKPVMVTREESGRWMTLRFDDQTGKNEPDAVFRIAALPHY